MSISEKESKSSSPWPLRGLALTVALVFWFFTSFLPRIQERIEPTLDQDFQATVSYERPEGFMILTPEPAITVTVNGGEERIANLRDEQVTLRIAFPDNPKPGSTEIPLSLSDVTLPEGLIAVRIDPDRLTLDIDRQDSRVISVRPQFTGEPTVGRRLADQHLVLPSTVTVTGAKQSLERLEFVTTVPIDVDGRILSFTEPRVRVLVDQPHIRNISPTLVDVRVILVNPDGTESVAQGGLQ